MRQLHRRIIAALLLVFGVLTIGCHHHRGSWDCASNAQSKAVIQADGQPGYVSANFGFVDSDVGEFSIESIFANDVIALDLEQCCCVAAKNAPIANAIDRERKVVCCQLGKNPCIDQFLEGQALQQRNKAATLAGELYLKLVQTELQKTIVESSMSKLDEFKTASQFAAERGFATVAADKRIEIEELQVAKKMVDIESAQIELIVKLNGLLGMGVSCPQPIEPKFDLTPVYEEIDVCDEFRKAMRNRPDLNRMSADQCGCIDKDCFLILSQLDSRLGVGVPATVKKCVLAQRLQRRSDCECECLRQEQLKDLWSARQDQVRAEVADAALDIQANYKKLALENEELERLEKQWIALELASELNSLESTVERIEIWAEQQIAKSKRIELAIEFEISKLKLLEATGQWTQICGLSSQRICQSNIPFPND